MTLPSIPEFESARFVDTHDRVLTRFFESISRRPDLWFAVPGELDQPGRTLLDATRDNREFFDWCDPDGRGTLRVFCDTQIDVHGRRWIKFVEAIPT